MNHDKVLEVENITKVYGKGENRTEALKGISFDVLEGEFLGIMGPSGSGKTTLLNSIATMIKVTSGKIWLKGEDISSFKGKELSGYRGKAIGYLFQEFELLDNLTGRENIILPLGLDGKKVNRDFVMDIVKSIGLSEKLKSLPSQLSGGQKQRVAIARALASRPAIILADEPTGNLDSKTEMEVISILKTCVHKYGQTLVMITHDETIAQMADRIVRIEDGKIVAGQLI